MALLNRKAAYGDLFPKGSVVEFMWRSLPLVDSRRRLPNQLHTATGRLDGIFALLNPMVAAGVRREEWDAPRDEHGELIPEPPPPRDPNVLTDKDRVKVKHRFRGVVTVMPHVAIEWLRSRQAELIEVIYG
jgi:hypothetical protein